MFGYTINNIYTKINKVDFVQIDKEDLSVNKDIYEDISEDITKDEFKEVKTVVFFGVDSRDVTNGFSGRSDTIMVASINPGNKNICLISIPRDTYVSIPGYGKDKINHAYSFGQEQLAIKTINENFNLNITDYVTIDFSGLINVINDVGGIELEISRDEMVYINNGVVESYNISKNKIKKLESYGKVNLTGEQALTHSRNRTIGDDFVRASRQRKVLEALIQKIASLDVVSIYKVSDSILNEVKTNIEIGKYLNIGINAIANKDEYLKNIILKQVPAAEYSSDKMIKGVYYFATDYNRAKEDFIRYIYGVKE